MALFRRLFYRKPPDHLVEISERVFVFDSCFSTDALEEDEYRNYMVGIVVQLRDFYPDASFMVFNFRKGDRRSQVSELLSEYAVTVMDYPSQYENCPLLPLEMIHHFLRASESWLSLERQQNVLLLHCERGGWPVLAFMLAVLLLYRNMYTGEQRTLEMVYKQAPRELLHLSSPLNPQPSHLRYLQYITRRGSGLGWPPMDKPFNLEFLLLRMVPNFDGKGGCRPAVRVYGQDPSTPANRGSKLLFSTPKTEEHIRHYRQEESTVVKLNVCCHVQGDVVIECIHLDKDLKHQKMMFRFMFNTDFVQFNGFSLSRDEIDVKWNAGDRFQKAFRVEIVTEPLRVNGNGHLGLAVEGDYRIEDRFVVDDIDPNNAGKVLADRLTSGSCEYKASVTDLSFSDRPSPSARVFHCEPSNPRESIAEAANCLDESDKTSSPIRQHSSPVDLEDGLIQFEKDIERANSVVTSNILKLVSAPQVRKEGKNHRQSFGGDEPFSTLGLEENLGVTISEYQESAIGEAGELIIDSSVGEIDLSNMQEMDSEDLVELKELGSGGFGTVYHGKWRGVDVAIKRIKKSSVVGQQSGQYRRILESLREAGILSKLQHPNIVSLFGFVLNESSSTLAIVTELVGGGSLRNILHREDIYLDRCKRLTIAKGAASGMEYLHLKNIVHFDLKCDNLLVDLKDPSRPICKVTDFGLSKIKKNTLITGGFRGTLPWMAPELLKRGNNKVSEKIDVYSFGIVMWEILTGEVPYDGMLEGEILGGIYDNTLRPPVPASCDPAWRELMEQCWDGDPQRRPSFAQIASRLHRMLVVSQAEASE